eukprot:TRINITY_DN6070_c0_g1_i2.p2 TRINITY_DN6070_c0_g1~~TRINITY_DN6070_c0_g1_i2.p2  ORF type:complete len:167 (-),score=7.50 TRINITY_DN6070_c0_g1_i2:633-1133(-)
MLFGSLTAMISFFAIIACIIATVLIYLWMRFCYFPGGYKRKEVMDMGEYAMLVAAMRLNKTDDQKNKEMFGAGEDGEYGDDGADELYYERDGEGDDDGASFGGEYGVGGGDDLESAADYRDDDSASYQGYDPSTTTPSSHRDSASYRDDRSESTYMASTPSTRYDY